MQAKDPFSQAVELPMMPSVGNFATAEDFDVNKYVIRYLKANISDDIERATLSEIETRGIRNDGIVLLSSNSMIFMDTYFVVIKYLEKVSR
jgi:hypothetical protein